MVRGKPRINVNYLNTCQKMKRNDSLNQGSISRIWNENANVFLHFSFTVIFGSLKLSMHLSVVISRYCSTLTAKTSDL